MVIGPKRCDRLLKSVFHAGPCAIGLYQIGSFGQGIHILVGKFISFIKGAAISLHKADLIGGLITQIALAVQDHYYF